ncbi:hypothetical protein Pst134EA_015897 [Puccinia striiformis f. sp. tritici]|uniref:HAT C-terminal dimerisation domain-containing protein n=1 Tax=Puccinia striiformis f. sp. tritici PST-78 TaxID=1165861 RepID=A0A0L0V6H4_9BASI|nr:hypothetical protein Pst134EA_015897 [Puccinia striiformis f. sp. tritici]KAH9463816.1 hypothetical protein Pst134EA_015897 [Puccinia striiformis f. sp. tritici]KNE94910.1 hypothetical protein PSTG_11807 [Puccinia striiformis f. sp. tritici PST-78]
MELSKDLANVLQLFYKITLQVSTEGSPRLSHVVVFIDQITEHLSTIISEKKYPAAMRNACRAGLQITNKYYTLTDCSPLYRVAMILHPSFKDEYFKIAGWSQEWIQAAIDLTREMWISNYKPQVKETGLETDVSKSKKSLTGFVSQLSAASAARSGNTSTDPLNIWLSGGLILEESAPVNALKWWLQQKRRGNTYGGLLNMALDVLSCPATSVDVERAFSFGRDYVTSKRHRLSAASVSRGMTVAFYSKNKKIKSGELSRFEEKLKTEKRNKTKMTG